MSEYTTSYAIRYSIKPIGDKTEVAVMKAASDITNADAGEPDHANRLAWANWANKNSFEAAASFKWPVAMNQSIINNVESDPTGNGVLDTDVQFVVNSTLDEVIADFVKNPPDGVSVPPA